MKAGDLVRYTWPDSFNAYRGQTGVVLEVNHWAEAGAPDKNFGVDVKVLWSNGRIESFDNTEIDIVEVIDE